MFKKLINLFKRDSIKRQIKKADKKAAKYKVQFLILPVKDVNIVVAGYSFLEEYNKKAKKIGSKRLTYPELLKIAIYKTAL